MKMLEEEGIVGIRAVRETTEHRFYFARLKVVGARGREEGVVLSAGSEHQDEE